MNSFSRWCIRVLLVPFVFLGCVVFLAKDAFQFGYREMSDIWYKRGPYA